MSWLELMNNVIEYIEDHLDGEMDMNELAKTAGFSLANLQRVFSIIADIPLSEYVRRRRLTQAAFDLQNSDIKVIDLALKYGYDSPEAFTRAFNAVHGTSPTAVRKKGVMLKAYPRISFLLTLKGDVPMNYRIEKKEAFSMYGIERVFRTENGENFEEIPKFWLDIVSDGRCEKLCKSTNLTEQDINDGLGMVHAICDYEQLEGSNLVYMISAILTDKSDTEGYKITDVPEATWAIFKSEMHTVAETSNVLQKLITRFYTDWLPNANYEKINGYELEMYYGSGDECWCELWVRVKAK